MKLILVLLALSIEIVDFQPDPKMRVATHSGMDPIYIQEMKLWGTLQADDRGVSEASFFECSQRQRHAANCDPFLHSFSDCKVGPLNFQIYTTRELGPDAAVLSVASR